VSLPSANNLHFVRLYACPSALLLTFYNSMLPESPRWLISRDRYQEAHAILVKYHAEGDEDSILVKAEMAQIRSTIKIEMDNSKQSWWNAPPYDHRLLPRSIHTAVRKFASQLLFKPSIHHDGLHYNLCQNKDQPCEPVLGPDKCYLTRSHSF
jgi:hypothetical protein